MQNLLSLSLSLSLSVCLSVRLCLYLCLSLSVSVSLFLSLSLNLKSMLDNKDELKLDFSPFLNEKSFSCLKYLVRIKNKCIPK